MTDLLIEAEPCLYTKGQKGKILCWGTVYLVVVSQARPFPFYCSTDRFLKFCVFVPWGPDRVQLLSTDLSLAREYRILKRSALRDGKGLGLRDSLGYISDSHGGGVALFQALFTCKQKDTRAGQGPGNWGDIYQLYRNLLLQEWGDI